MVKERLTELALEGALASSAVVELEVRFTAQTASDYAGIALERSSAFKLVATTNEAAEAAMTTQGRLAATGRHRAASLPDLLIAATAASHGLTVLHYDHDFEIIASVTGQAVERVAPPGSFPEPAGRPYLVFRETRAGSHTLIETVDAENPAAALEAAVGRPAATGAYAVVPRRRWRRAEVTSEGEIRFTDPDSRPGRAP